jgi:hypothetical protein
MNYRRIVSLAAAVLTVSAFAVGAHAQQKISVTFATQSTPPLYSGAYQYVTSKASSVQFDRSGELRIENPSLSRPFTLDLGPSTPFAAETGTTNVAGAVYTYCERYGLVPPGKLKGGESTVCPVLLRIDAPAPAGYFYRLAFNKPNRGGASDVRFTCTGVKPGTTTCNQWNAVPAENEVTSDGTLDGRGLAELLKVNSTTMEEVSTSGYFDVIFKMNIAAQ